MNKYERRALAERKAGVRSSMTLWSAGIALIVVVFLILGLSTPVPSNFFSKVAVGGGVLLLFVRILSRVLQKGPPKAAQPDPKSRLNLD